VVIGRVLRADRPLCAPLPVRVLCRVPALQKVPGWSASACARNAWDLKGW
jgi:hypothetical protein